MFIKLMEKKDKVHAFPTAVPDRPGIRDVPDLEQYVRLAVDRVAPAARQERRSSLLAHGVRAVRRLERALPPGAPLLPILEDVLPGRLASLDHVLAHAERGLPAVA